MAKNRSDIVTYDDEDGLKFKIKEDKEEAVEKDLEMINNEKVVKTVKEIPEASEKVELLLKSIPTFEKILKTFLLLKNIIAIKQFHFTHYDDI